MSDKIKKDAKFGIWRIIEDEPLGQGGNSIVWRAENDYGISGAIKFFTRNPESDRYGRFIDEVQFHVSLGERDGILPVLDHYLPKEPKKSDRPWLVTKLATPLRHGIAFDFSPSRVVELIHNVAGTLAKLHREEAAHRDIKPENLFILNGNSVIGDFGLVTYPGKEVRTKRSERMGPVYYMAPEMLQDADRMDAYAADVYSLAKTLWVLAANQNFPPPGTHRRDEPSLRLSTYANFHRATAVDRLIEGATAHHPAVRPTMEQFADELHAAMQHLPNVSGESPDLSDLADELQKLTAPALREGQRIDELRIDASGIHSQLETQLEMVADKLATVTALAPTIDYDYELLERHATRQTLGRRGPFWAEPVVCRVKLPRSNFVELKIGYIVEVFDDGRIRIVGIHCIEQGHEFTTNTHISEIIALWKKEITGESGTAGLENDWHQLVHESNDQITTSVKAFRDAIKD